METNAWLSILTGKLKKKLYGLFTHCCIYLLYDYDSLS